ncbi:MAG: NAD-dependent epimerase/dehydratase family protein [Ignavibacteriota bacterium]
MKYGRIFSPMLNNRPYALVTGAAGFLGAHVVRELLKKDDVTVIALDDLSGGFEENLLPGVEFIRGSVTDARLLADIFEKFKFRYIYHLAAYAAEAFRISSDVLTTRTI